MMKQQQGHPMPTKETSSDDDSLLPTPSLPLGQAIPFQTDLFDGKLLFRVRGMNGQNEMAYFTKNNRRRLYQVIVQGRFLNANITFGDVYIGAKYDKPFEGIPLRNSSLMKAVQTFLQKINPGMIFDINADRPKIMTPIGSCQKLRVDVPGTEPHITSEDCLRHGIVENTTLLTRNDGESFTSVADRRRQLTDPKVASQITFNPSLVYTFEIYDHTIDFANYKQRFSSLVKIDLSNKLNGQPLSISAMVVQGDEEGTVLYDFQVWHERLIASINKKKRQEKRKQRQQHQQEQSLSRRTSTATTSNTVTEDETFD
jgi:hypothetical protein